jgi:glucose-6-phosphate 1-dehydrogenase
MTAPRSDALVFFGATGDLAYKQIFPALQAMIRHSHLDMPIVGVAKSGWNLDQLKARAKDSLEKHGGVDQLAFEKLSKLLQYVDGDYGDPATFTQLRKLLGNAKRPLHYLAIPPSLFATVAGGLAKAGCAQDARVVVEKPFGRDLASARELNATLSEFFPESAIFRIDHYLGKEPVQNLVYFRFANPFVEAAWNHRHVRDVQITMAENFGVAGRGKFYEEAGAVRDVVQNHMLEVVANLAMESPVGGSYEARRDVRGKLLESVRTMSPADIVRGQFRGYRNEPGVAADSKVETFAAMRLHIDNDRWKGVPFYIRVGKCLPVTVTEVLVRFKPPPKPVLDDTIEMPTNYCRLRLSPEMVLALAIRVKKPGELLTGEQVELIAHHRPEDEMLPYERLLGDALDGDGTLFAREDFVESAWRVVDPVLAIDTPPIEYEPNTWGPPEATEVGPAGGWYNPQLESLA